MQNNPYFWFLIKFFPKDLENEKKYFEVLLSL